jgi:hypothetical protein
MVSDNDTLARSRMSTRNSYSSINLLPEDEINKDNSKD